MNNYTDLGYSNDIPFNQANNYIPKNINAFTDQTVDNVLKQNKGKQVNVYTSFPETNEWKDKIFPGIIEEAGKDHIIISEPSTGKWHLIPLHYINFIIFDEAINH